MLFDVECSSLCSSLECNLINNLNILKKLANIFFVHTLIRIKHWWKKYWQRRSYLMHQRVKHNQLLQKLLATPLKITNSHRTSSPYHPYCARAQPLSLASTTNKPCSGTIHFSALAHFWSSVPQHSLLHAQAHKCSKYMMLYPCCIIRCDCSSQ